MIILKNYNFVHFILTPVFLVSKSVKCKHFVLVKEHFSFQPRSISIPLRKVDYNAD